MKVILTGRNSIFRPCAYDMARQSTIKSFFNTKPKRPKISSEPGDLVKDLGESDDADCFSGSDDGDSGDDDSADFSDIDIDSESISNVTVQSDERSERSCSSQCCKDGISEPHHPANIRLSKKEQGKQNRSFSRHGLYTTHVVNILL